MTSGTVAAARVLARGGRGVTAAAKANPKPTAGATNSRSPPAAATPSGVRQDINTAAPIIISAGGALAAASFAAGFHLLSPAVFENDGKEEENGRLHRIPNRQLPHEPQIPWSLSSHLYSRALKAFCDMFAGTSRIYPSSCGGGGGSVARCEEREDDDDSASEDELLHRFEARYPTGYTEPERFAQALEYHRSLLFDYLRRWEMGMNHLQPTEQPRSRNHHHPQQHRHPPLPANQTTGEAENHGAGNSGSAGSNIESSSSSTAWPRHVPNACDIPALEFDLKYCLKRRRRRRRHQHGNSDAGSDLEASAKNPAPDQKNNHPMAASSPANPRQDRPDAPAVLSDVCQNVQFRVATYYLSRAGHNDDLRRGFRIVKELAEQGHPDGMCLYGTFPRA